MAKLILFSIVLVSFVVPMHLSARRSPKRSLRRAQWIILAFIILWAYMCIAWYPRLVPIE